MFHKPKDIRLSFARIGKRITMLYSKGSIEVQRGRYVEDKEVSYLWDRYKKYSFIK